MSICGSLWEDRAQKALLETAGRESGQIYWEEVVGAWAQELKVYPVGNGEALSGFEQMIHTARGIVGQLIQCW